MMRPTELAQLARINVSACDQLGEPVDPRILRIAESAGPVQRQRPPTAWERLLAAVTFTRPWARPLPMAPVPRGADASVNAAATSGRPHRRAGRPPAALSPGWWRERADVRRERRRFNELARAFTAVRGDARETELLGICVDLHNAGWPGSGAQLVQLARHLDERGYRPFADAAEAA